ncbi:hypothetical protein LX15_000942 [Streptoalloteichus tenebrarius]|uniref:Cellulose biosynthesis protein BcsF n=1 Tax=Streptoalloteichus tenebrarius (strain ATCC 17920 / DSM 40477 / JCM 4838 / CBS 697.72 / NBRC 16177 / NCIMB 11028 / NRRL B-12390 / A12253. 1 / ISP 5477) TaxID=1933 RepID=A0ABT1HP30_STRSD|nr:hypothetical protein [Streptoalloteichus tenebrarius]MCP2257257.1 hypothetical protein [Streptoalloteichus tenebrarius]BFF04163.1 hypothetical protein GCM10020241_58380 [Streptoalloteichus tenebrarius]
MTTFVINLAAIAVDVIIMSWLLLPPVFRRAAQLFRRVRRDLRRWNHERRQRRDEPPTTPTTQATRSTR